MQMTVKDGVRWSCANAYLRPAMGRPNLKVVTKALTERVLIEGRRAVGVTYLAGGVTPMFVHARREVILSAGSIGSPHLLQLSGIGPGAVLRGAGIDIVHDLPGVGENLQDHLEVYFQYNCKQPLSLNARLGPMSKFLIGARWFFFKSGLGATNHFESCGFIRSRAGIEFPDIQYHFLPAAMRYDGAAAVEGHGFQVHVGPNKPKSRGWVRAVSPDAIDKPRILFNYMEAEADREGFRAAIRLTREIFAQAAMEPYAGPVIQPADHITSDADIDAWVRQNGESAYHPSCTCRIGGPGDPLAVLDPQCRLRGIDNLRVIDSSVFPTITNGNLNAPTIMLAEKAADMVLGVEPLAPSNAEHWTDPEWRTRQRLNPL